MTAEQAEIVGQDMAVERLAELSAERTTTDASDQATENGAGCRAEFRRLRATDAEEAQRP